jgi:hypothetical protein
MATRIDFYPLGEKTPLYFCILILLSQCFKLIVFPRKESLLRMLRTLSESD